MVEEEVGRVKEDIRDCQRAYFWRLLALFWHLVSPDRVFDDKRPLERLEGYDEHCQLAGVIEPKKVTHFEQRTTHNPSKIQMSKAHGIGIAKGAGQVVKWGGNLLKRIGFKR